MQVFNMLTLFNRIRSNLTVTPYPIKRYFLKHNCVIEFLHYKVGEGAI